MSEPVVALWNFQPRPAHVLVVLQPARVFFVRELAPRTAMHLEARILRDARVFFAGSAEEARGLAGSIAAGFTESRLPEDMGATATAETEAPGPREAREARRRTQGGAQWLRGRRRSR